MVMAQPPKAKSGYPLFHLQKTADEEPMGTCCGEIRMKRRMNDDKADIDLFIGVGHDRWSYVCHSAGCR